MQGLIQIIPNEQGSSVVSARDLHTFLEVKSRFADWFKNRVNAYEFVEDVDYTPLTDSTEGGFSKNLEKVGRPELDYLLTLDMAKELSMVERNQRGREARQYFIAIETNARQLLAGLVPSESLLEPYITDLHNEIKQLFHQQSQVLAYQQVFIEELKADLTALRQSANQPRKGLVAEPEGLTFMTLRQQVSKRVIEYCKLNNCEQSQTYNYLYKRLNAVYGVNVFRLQRNSGENYLDAIDRHGYTEYLHSLIVSELTYVE